MNRPAAAALLAVAGVAAAGESYVPLEALARSWSMTVTRSSKTLVELRGERTTLQFQPLTRQLRVNGTLVWLNDTVREDRGRWALNIADRVGTVEPILWPSRHLAGRSATLVLLDPGHGGDDPGASGPDGLLEKFLTLDLARRVRVHLANAGIRSMLTRDADRTLGLDERAALIRRHRAQVFVSLHFNTAASREICGVETFVLTPRGYQSTAGGESAAWRQSAFPGNRHDSANVVLAYQIQRSLRQWLGPAHDRGLRRARFQVLREATCPAVLVECGFLSHPATARRLRSAEYLDALAQRVALGVQDYVRLVRAAAPAR
ncbi:MAG: N-acetylmuramoyl-L-alanine amidase [Kiritimatiellae bacterium]|nr:N-acetylmuramoyl-L-alanine amidase [Kiritimatiellia bacterium]